METDDLAFVQECRRQVTYRSLDKLSLKDGQRLLAIAERGAAVQWRPIAEAPIDSSLFLAWIPDREYSYVVSGYCMDDGWFIPVEGDSDVEPTHFIPLSALAIPETKP